MGVRNLWHHRTPADATRERENVISRNDVTGFADTGSRLGI
jgi:hypothetical protein